MSVYQKMAKFIAEGYHGYAENSYLVTGKIFQNQLTTIQKILNELEYKKPTYKRKPD